MIRFGCPQCGKMLEAAREKAGKPMTCPRCQELCTAPTSAAASPGASKDTGPSALAARSSGQAALDAEQSPGLLSGMTFTVRCAVAVVAGLGVVNLLALVLPSVLPVQRAVGEATSTWALILGSGSVVLLLVILHGQGTGCPACQKWWVRMKAETEFVDREVFDRKGVPFVRSLSREIFECESCRHRWSVLYTDEYPKPVREGQKHW